MGEELVVKLNELLSFILAAVGAGIVAYPTSNLYLVSWIAGTTTTQVTWLGLGLVAIAVYLFEWPPRLLRRAIT